MADEVTTAAAPAATTAAPTDGAQPTAAQATTQTQTPETAAVPGWTLNKEEWLDFRREWRNKLKEIAPEPKPTKGAETPPAGDAMAEITRLRAEMAFHQAVTRVGVPLSESQLDDLSALYSMQKPENAGEWLSKKVEAFGLKKPPATTPAPVPVKPTPAPAPGARSDAGAPATTAAMNVAGAQMQDLDAAALKQMTAEQRRQQVWPNVAGAQKANPFRRTGGQ